MQSTNDDVLTGSYRWGGAVIAVLGLVMLLSPQFLVDERLDFPLYTAGAMVAVTGVVRFVASFIPAFAHALAMAFWPFLLFIAALGVAYEFGVLNDYLPAFIPPR